MEGIAIEILGYAQRISKYFCKMLHFFLISAFVIIITLLVYSGLTSIFLIQSTIPKAVFLVIGFWLVFNVVYNYAMAILVEPGSPDRLSNSILNLTSVRCKKCALLKPPRTHHCSMCDKCILHMDHHCPWIGACVGFYNRRFFQIFQLIHALPQPMSQSLELILDKSMVFDIIIQDSIQILSFVGTLLACLGVFTLFHWYIALRGKTTLQCCFPDSRYQPSSNFGVNLQLIYGTRNFFIAMLPTNKLIQYEYPNNGLNQQTQVPDAMIQTVSL